jgi:hypothetical protein
MELYKQYLEERHNNKSLLFSEAGFATYIWDENEIYMEDCFILPNYRKSHLASSFADQLCEIGKEKGCKVLTTSIVPSTKNPEVILNVVLKYGFKVLKSEENIIWFYKEI